MLDVILDLKCYFYVWLNCFSCLESYLKWRSFYTNRVTQISLFSASGTVVVCGSKISLKSHYQLEWLVLWDGWLWWGPWISIGHWDLFGPLHLLSDPYGVTWPYPSSKELLFVVLLESYTHWNWVYWYIKENLLERNTMK